MHKLFFLILLITLLNLSLHISYARSEDGRPSDAFGIEKHIRFGVPVPGPCSWHFSSPAGSNLFNPICGGTCPPGSTCQPRNLRVATNIGGGFLPLCLCIKDADIDKTVTNETLSPASTTASPASSPIPSIP